MCKLISFYVCPPYHSTNVENEYRGLTRNLKHSGWRWSLNLKWHGTTFTCNSLCVVKNRIIPNYCDWWIQHSNPNRRCDKEVTYLTALGQNTEMIRNEDKNDETCQLTSSGDNNNMVVLLIIITVDNNSSERWLTCHRLQWLGSENRESNRKDKWSMRTIPTATPFVIHNYRPSTVPTTRKSRKPFHAS